ncbi:MAG: BatA domain-containing protein [Planctomycetaceae bacterium]|nr:BatA domain-containing protein [Planctomycetaceae bacterium]
MSFLNGLFLLALPLAAVPVLLHFFRRKQRDVVQWGAMQFLIDAAQKGRRWERLEELLLMLLRCAAVLALVLALARPQLRGQWFGDHPSREVILVLDNSMSMSRDVGEETPFAELQQRVKDTLDELSESDSVQLMLAVGGPDWQTAEGVAVDSLTRAQLQQDIDKLTPSQGTADLFSSVQAAIDAVADDEIQLRHVLVFTDQQAHGWQANAARNWQQLKEAMERNDMRTSVQVVPCGAFSDPVANVAVVGIEASHTQVGLDQSVTVRAQVQNFGEKSSAPMSLDQLESGQVTGSSSIAELAPGETATVSWKWRSGEAGVYPLSCRLQSEDQLTLDDENTVVVQVVDRVPVLIVEPPADYRQRVSNAAFFTTAIGYEEESPHAEWHAVFAPKLITPDELEQESLADYQAVVLTNLPPLVTETIEELRRFVERGGGLWVVLGRRTDRESFNAAWYQDGGGLSPLPLDELKTLDEDSTEEETIHPPSGEHPATAQLSDTNRLDIDAVRIRSRHVFDRSSAGEELSVLLETGDGAPLVTEQYVGRGRVIIQALPFDVGWSNLPMTKAHVVMVNDWLAYLTQPAATQFNVQTGARIELPQALADSQTEVTLVSPDGKDHDLSLQANDDLAGFRYSNTLLPGRYDVKYFGPENETLTIPFQVRRDALESDLTPLSAEQETSLIDTAGLTFAESETPEIPVVTSGEHDRPVWTPLLVGLLILLGVELLLATRSARSRTGDVSLPSFIETSAGSQ